MTAQEVFIKLKGTNNDGEEGYTTQDLQSFDSDGFTMGILGGMN